MKLSRFTILLLCGLLPQVFVAQNVQVVVGQQLDFGQRQPIATPQIGVPATPIASFATPAPVVGISNQGRAGISSNIEFAEGASSTLTPPPLVYQNATMWSAPETPETSAVAQQQPQEEINAGDLGPSFFVGAKSPEKNLSLGEVAASYKALSRAKSVRVFTNTD